MKNYGWKKICFKTYAKIILFSAVVGLFPLQTIKPVTAKEHCYSLFCVDSERDDDNNFNFTIRNTQTYDVTVRLEFTELLNLEANEDLPYIVTIPGKKTNKDLSIHIIDPKQRCSYRYRTYSTKGSIDAEHDDDYVYSLPFAPGASFKVSQGFNGTFSHNGELQYAIDWQMPVGTPVYAARDGKVVGVESRNNVGGSDKSFSDKANYVYIKHSDETMGTYLHLKQNGVVVKLGQKVNAGDLLGYSGNTGWSGGPHLHFMVYKVAPDGKARQSVPIEFETDTEEHTVLKQGKTYTAPEYEE